VLCRLAVFAGGFVLEAAEFVCAVQRTASSDVVELLTNLVAKSLVQVSESDGVARYRLLETVRAYAFEHLQNTGEAVTVRARHAAYYLGLAEEAAAVVWGPHIFGRFGQTEHTQFIPVARELDNLRAALTWAGERREAEIFARLGIALWAFWFIEGYIGEGWRWMQSGLVLRNDLKPTLRARSLGIAAALAFWHGDNTTAMRLGEEALPLFREQGDDWNVGFILTALGLMDGFRGDLEAARPGCVESVVVYERLGDNFGLGLALLDYGEVLWYCGRTDEARTLFVQSLTPLRRAEDIFILVEALTNLGGLEVATGNAERATEWTREALTLLRSSGLPYYLPEVLELSAELATVNGAARRAARLFGAAEIARELSGAARYPTSDAGYRLALERARTALPADAFSVAWASGRTLSAHQAIDEALAATSANPASAAVPARPAWPTVPWADSPSANLR
jgi:predicted ATPase